MMHAQHALSWLESLKLREYQHSQRDQCGRRSYSANLAEFAEPLINCSTTRRTAVNQGNSLMTRNERGYKKAHPLPKQLELRSQPALEPETAKRRV